MRKIIKITAILLCLCLVFAGCGKSVQPVDLTIDGSSIYFDSIEDATEFINQVQNGTIDYDAYEVPATVKAVVYSTDLEELEMFTYFETLSDGITLDCVIMGSGSICVAYDMGVDYSDSDLSEYDAYMMNTITLTTYVTDNPQMLFEGFYNSGSYTMSADGNSFYGMFGQYSVMSVQMGGENQVMAMLFPITFNEEYAEGTVLGAVEF